MELNFYKRVLKLLTLVPVFSFSLTSLFAQEFDPKTVLPQGCLDSSYKCGYTPPTPAQEASIPVADSAMIRHRGLPSKYDMSSFMPPVGNQGQQGSCTAWSTTYYVKSYKEKIKRKWKYDSPVEGKAGERVFSPAFVYNQINGGQDEGSRIDVALNLIVQMGAASWKSMPYRENDYRTQPSASTLNEANRYRAETFYSLPYRNLDAIKSELSQGHPVNFGMPIDDGFTNLKNKVYDRAYGRMYGGHAMVLVGYDDDKVSPNGDTGAFKFINSWGTRWGDKGFGWISYRRWLEVSPHLYVLKDTIRIGTPSSDQEEKPENNVNPDTRISPPRNVTATKGSYSDKIIIQWSAVEGAVVYAVFRTDPFGENTFLPIGYASNSPPSFIDRSIQQDVMYRYLVIAIVDGNNFSDPEISPMSEGYAIRNKVTPPTQVVGVTGEVKMLNGRVSVDLRWNSEVNAVGYSIERWNAPRYEWQRIAQTNQISYRDVSPVSDTTNIYRIAASNQFGVGPFSETLVIKVSGQRSPPNAVADLEATKGDFKDHILVRWSASPFAKSYYLFRYDYSKSKWSDPVELQTTSYQDRDASVLNGRYFAYSVVAANDHGYGNHSQLAQGYTNPYLTKGVTLPPPSQVDVKLIGDEFTLTWGQVKGADEYYILEKKNGESQYRFKVNVDKNTARYKAKIPGVAGDLYYYVVRSKSALGGESADSRVLPVFRNKEIPLERHRFISGEGADRFTGTWSATYWDGASEPLPLSIELNAEAGAFVKGNIIRGSGQKASSYPVNGSYLFGAKSIDMNSFIMELSNDVKDVAIVTINNPAIARRNTVITFTKN